MLSRRDQSSGLGSKFFEPSLLDLATAPKVDTQAVGHGAQVSAGLRNAPEVPRRSQQTQKSIMRQISCVSSVTQPPA